MAEAPALGAKPEPQVAVWFGVLSGDLQRLAVSVDTLTARINPVLWVPGTLNAKTVQAEASLPPLAPLADALRAKCITLREIIDRIDDVTRCVEV